MVHKIDITPYGCSNLKIVATSYYVRQKFPFYGKQLQQFVGILVTLEAHNLYNAVLSRAVFGTEISPMFRQI
jgi:hypothetical protein